MDTTDIDWSDMLVKLGAAIIIVVLTWIIARVVKNLLSKYLARVKVLNRPDSGQPLSESLGTIGSLIIWLFGLVAILNLFALTEVVGPIQGLLGGILTALPKILAAALILVIGFVLAKVVRELVTAGLRALHVDQGLQRLQNRAGSEIAGAAGETPTAGTTTEATTGDLQISTVVGQILFVIVLAVVAIAAFDTLGIRAISDPATAMLHTILDAIPAILGAALLLAIGVVIARIVGGLLESVLRGAGLQGAVEGLGVDTDGHDVPAIGAKIAQVAIVLFFAIAATRILNFPELTDLVNTVLSLGGRVLFGAAVILAGVLIGNLLGRTVTGQTGRILRWGAIALFVAMGLRYMGLADSIVNLAFGAIVVGGALAAAIAFGLGGREAAARQLQRLEEEPAVATSTTRPDPSGTDGPTDPPGPGDDTRPLT